MKIHNTYLILDVVKEIIITKDYLVVKANNVRTRYIY